MGDYGVTVKSLNSTRTPAHPLPALSVLVTGFGPFKTNAVNASYLVASALPPLFTYTSKTESGLFERSVYIHVHPSSIPVAYSAVRSTLPEILTQFADTHGGRRPDLVIHIGIASARPYYSVEVQAHRDDYNITDINGELGYEDGEKIWKEMGLPPILTPGSTKAEEKGSAITPYPPNEHFLQTWKAFAPPDLDIRLSHDAGHYLCDFIYYTSLSLAQLQDQDRNVLFLHVPASPEEAAIERGRKIALALMKTMATCWVDEKHAT
ncbi:hypothetical protein N7495_001543 [Penicillium taxi]|uniref:uncharacterized protein n=1 Tax=Penicillium taxi TaxID=168475 RepID=UPI0025458582|nr:uncharacterized protein N7495_001543 [Penicillium taxi]KAJ5908861.1 hypothetical protein N7495_001543 [Penicillium taxi]